MGGFVVSHNREEVLYACIAGKQCKNKEALSLYLPCCDFPIGKAPDFPEVHKYASKLQTYFQLRDPTSIGLQKDLLTALVPGL